MSNQARNKKATFFKVAVNKDRCKGCGLCIIYCPTRYLLFSSDLNKRGLKYIVIDKKNKCVGCGNCFFICPDACIEIYKK